MHETTLLSQKGQVVLPKALRDACRWSLGTRLTVRETPDGLLLTAAAPPTTREARPLDAATIAFKACLLTLRTLQSRAGKLSSRNREGTCHVHRHP